MPDATGAWDAYNNVGVEPAAWAVETDKIAEEESVNESNEDDEPGDDWPTDNDEEEFVIVDEVDGFEVADEVGDPENAHDNEPMDNEPMANEEIQDTAAADVIKLRYNLRAQRGRDYSHCLAQQMDSTTCSQSYDLQHQFAQVNSTTPGFIFGHIMTQMTATAGIKKHGQKAIDALLKEFCQLDNKSVFAAVDAGTLSAKQKFAALRAINLIKEKRDGTIKGRSYADGRPQRALYTKEQSASPTVSTDALMISLMIDAKERRDVATTDVVGAYLLADMDEYVLLKLTGESVDIMCTVNAKYVAFVVIENGKKVLYLQLKKALYGCVRSALLWYELFAGTLKKMGFELNPYDPCIANKVIEGAQCTIAWYVDDTKISHIKSRWLPR
jgi:hypothetical protein